MSEIKEIRSDIGLLRALHEALNKHQTAEELREQRISFIRASVDHSTITRSQIEEVLSMSEG